MTSIVTDFKSIKRILNRQEQKAEFEAKNPEPSMYGWPYGVACPMADGLVWSDYQQAWVSSDWKPVLDAWGVKI